MPIKDNAQQLSRDAEMGWEVAGREGILGLVLGQGREGDNSETSAEQESAKGSRKQRFELGLEAESQGKSWGSGISRSLSAGVFYALAPTTLHCRYFQCTAL